ncbi:hypothetical protein OIU84_022288 [Salix udensis]|uniref:Uncharacterized protein n=1 Tax=Salix udensis TaxID=889485 RepID=A0AAD6KQI8_9ROSI|nr:hypothetical protein OIU84_022288 [Salix udensis]
MGSGIFGIFHVGIYRELDRVHLRTLELNTMGASRPPIPLLFRGIYGDEEWPDEEEKEQSSPVSILDCPFHDEEEEEEEEEDISSPVQRSLICVEGTKQKLVQKIRRFESLAQLDPLDLEKRIAAAEMEDESPLQHCSTDSSILKMETKENGTEKDAQELLEHVKSTVASRSLASKVESLLLDFFEERIEENKAGGSVAGSYRGFEQELKVAREWIDGQPEEMFSGVGDGGEEACLHQTYGAEWEVGEGGSRKRRGCSGTGS